MQKDNIIFFSIILILLSCIFGIMFLFPIISASSNCGNINITSSITNNHNIRWDYNIEDNITQLSIDGKFITDFDNQSGVYIYGTADGRDTGEHTIKLYNISDNGCNTSHILPPVSENISNVINAYILFILGLICVIIGFWVSPLGLGACLFAVLGYLQPDNTFTLIILYTLILIVGIIEGFSSSWSG